MKTEKSTAFYRVDYWDGEVWQVVYEYDKLPASMARYSEHLAKHEFVRLLHVVATEDVMVLIDAPEGFKNRSRE